MVGTNRLALAVEALKKHDGEVLSLAKLEQIVMMRLSSKSVREYLRLMDAAGLLFEVEPFRFKVDLSAYYKEFGGGAKEAGK